MLIKDGFHFEFYSGLPTELPTISVLESSGLPTELPIELHTISWYGSSGQPYLHGKILMGIPLRCPPSCPLSPYMEVVGSLICMSKIPMDGPWAAHFTAHFFHIWKSWAAHWTTHCFSYMEVVSSLIGMAKIPMGSPLRCQLSCQLFHIWKQWVTYWAAHCFHIWK